MQDRSRDDLNQALIHLGYELETCIETACALRAYQADGAIDAHAPAVLDPGLIRNALVEAHLLHARALIEFFIETKSPQPGDILRTQFATEWSPQPAEAVRRLATFKRTINKHLAHLTWDRVDDVEPLPSEKYGAIARDIVAVARAWADHVASPDHRHELAPIVNIQVSKAEGIWCSESSPPLNALTWKTSSH
jgi:hypothetical protein